MYFLLLGLLSLCSFPPSLQFFCEVFLLWKASYSVLCVIYLSLYLFFGGIIPMVLCANLLCRCEGVNSSVVSYNYLYYFFYLVVWCFMSVVVL